MGITGSVGKTSTKDLLHHLLGRRFPVASNWDTVNAGAAFLQTLWKTGWSRPNILIQEVGAFKPGSVARMTRQVRPSVAVVTVVLREHYRAFRTFDAVAAEKGDLVAALPPDGLAVLNRDDDRVWAMRERTQARVVGYGTGEHADVRWGSHHAVWPRTFAGWFESEGQRHEFETRLIGDHWGPVVAAATTAARELGLSWEDIVSGLATFTSVDRRMQGMTVRGVHFLDDSFKNGWDAIPRALDVLRSAQTAGRKFLVMGSISDRAGDSKGTYRKVVRMVEHDVDRVWFLRRDVEPTEGPRPSWHPKVREFTHIQALFDDLAGELAEGDLVLLKGAGVDRMARIWMAWEHPAICWRMNCQMKTPCGSCRFLRS